MQQFPNITFPNITFELRRAIHLQVHLEPYGVNTRGRNSGAGGRKDEARVWRGTRLHIVDSHYNLYDYRIDTFYCVSLTKYKLARKSKKLHCSVKSLRIAQSCISIHNLLHTFFYCQLVIRKTCTTTGKIAGAPIPIV